MTMRWLFAVSVLVTLSTAHAMTGVVTHVTDGDTVWVREEGRKPVSVRLHGIDAPERCQDGGEDATEALTARVLKRQVHVDTHAVDGYGRLVGTVTLGGEDIGEWLVKQGHAWSPGYRGTPGPYADAERLARSRHRGLFARPAIEPKVFRKEHGPCPRPAGRTRPAAVR